MVEIILAYVELLLFRHSIPKSCIIAFVIPARSGNRGFYINAGGSPAANHFLLFGQEKVIKEKATLPTALRVPSAAHQARRLRNSTSRPKGARDSNSARRLLLAWLRCSAVRKGFPKP